ncbi:MAG: metallophosphoesterase [Myxococcaceae bacterium]
MRRGYLVRMVFMFLIALSIVVGLHAYIGKRLFVDSGIPAGAAAIGWALLAFGFLTIPLGFMAFRAFPPKISRVLSWGGYLWMGAFAMLLVAVAGTDLVRLIVISVPHPSVSLAAGQIQAAAVLALVIPALIIGYRTARGPARIERVKVPIKDLPAELEGLRIAQISDIHIGPTLHGDFLQRVADQVNELKPDAIAITGDLVDGTVLQLRPHMAALDTLKAPLGAYFVTGNHEYYSGGPAWEAEVARHGIKVLHNEHVVLERNGKKLVLAGVTDHEAGQFGPEHACDVAAAFSGAPENAPRVLLAHQPRTAKLAAPHKVDLQLSGHTHGGQFFPWMFFVRLQQPSVSGMANIYGVRVYTSRGTGYWGPPIRLGPSPEITELTLVRA